MYFFDIFCHTCPNQYILTWGTVRAQITLPHVSKISFERNFNIVTSVIAVLTPCLAMDSCLCKTFLLYSVNQSKIQKEKMVWLPRKQLSTIVQMKWRWEITANLNQSKMWTADTVLLAIKGPDMKPDLKWYLYYVYQLASIYTYKYNKIREL